MDRGSRWRWHRTKFTAAASVAARSAAFTASSSHQVGDEPLALLIARRQPRQQAIALGFLGSQRGAHAHARCGIGAMGAIGLASIS